MQCAVCSVHNKNVHCVAILGAGPAQAAHIAARVPRVQQQTDIGGG